MVLALKRQKSHFSNLSVCLSLRHALHQMWLDVWVVNLRDYEPLSPLFYQADNSREKIC
jgi:hypothetical protein